MRIRVECVTTRGSSLIMQVGLSLLFDRPPAGGVMRIATLDRWHWVVTALLVGLTCGGVWQSARNDLDDGLDRYGALMTDQRQFEAALVSQAQGLPLFRDIRVYPYRTPRSRRPRATRLCRGGTVLGRKATRA